jgi:hypothetical protein
MGPSTPKIRSPQRLFPKDVSETDTITFDYSSSLSESETIVSAVVLVSVLGDVRDPSPQATFNGVCAISGSSVLQSVTGGLRNVEYLFSCRASLSSGRVLLSSKILPVIQEGQS